jgi:hypothetical protein
MRARGLRGPVIAKIHARRDANAVRRLAAQRTERMRRATMTRTREAITMPRALDDLDQLNASAREELNRALRPGEVVRCIIRGSYNMALIATEDRLFSYHTSHVTLGAGGHAWTEWDLADLTGIEVTTGFTGGHVIVQGHGTLGRRDPLAPEYLILTGWPSNDHFEQVKRAAPVLRLLIAESKKRHHRATAGSQDAGERLRALEALRSDGLVTDEEFRAKRAELLELL